MTDGTAQAGNTLSAGRWSPLAPIVAIAMAGASPAGAQVPTTVLVDSNGRIAARALSETHVLVTDPLTRVIAPAAIRPIRGDDGRTASGLATWGSGGSVLYTSPDCSIGAYIYSDSSAGFRAASQVETPSGIVLVIGGIGFATTVTVRSILYDNGCASVTIRQNGLVPVDATVNLTTTYPPPLSFR